MKHLLLSLLAAAVLPAAAQSSNWATWSPVGDVSATPGSALLSTAAFESGETPASGTSAALWFDVESAIGAPLDGDTIEGSALATSFSAVAGTRVSVNWSLSTVGFDPAFADRAYVVLDGQLQTLATVGAALQAGTFSFTVGGSGTHTLAFAVMDVNDVAGVSQLALSGLQVTPVPEPATVALWLAGLGVVGGIARRRRTAV